MPNAERAVAPDIATLPNDLLHSMKDRLTNWLVGILAIDLLLVIGLVYLWIARTPTHVIPFMPLLMIPSLALVPVLRRVGAIRRELAAREARGRSA
jgi:hypothetical protein